MASHKEHILFLPGIAAQESGAYLERLKQGLRRHCSREGIDLDDEQEDEGTVKFTLNAGGTSREIEVREVNWTELLPKMSASSIPRKVVYGLALFWYWTTSGRTWRRIMGHKFMMLNILITLLTLIIWYYGAIATAFDAIGENHPEFQNVAFLQMIFDWIQVAGNAMGSWYVWGIAMAIMGVIPVRRMVDISYATKAYLLDTMHLYQKVLGRARRTLRSMLANSENVDRITVLGHSFGAVVATELLANHSSLPESKVRLITLGSPLLLAGARSDRVQNAIDEMIRNQPIIQWRDFYSEGDWFCTRSPVPEDNEKFKSTALNVHVPLDQRIRGISHDMYFDDHKVMEALVD